MGGPSSLTCLGVADHGTQKRSRRPVGESGCLIDLLTRSSGDAHPKQCKRKPVLATISKAGLGPYSRKPAPVPGKEASPSAGRLQ